MTDTATAPSKHTVPIPRGQYSATITPPWFVDKSEYTPKLASFRAMVNGEEAFREVYLAIEAAKRSVSYICWAFQPSMYFIRDGQHLMIGELLEKKAREGVMVRVLCWAFQISRLPANLTGVPSGLNESNTPGRWSLAMYDRPDTSTDAQYDYDCKWYRIYDRKQSRANEFSRRHFISDDFPKDKLLFTSRTYSLPDKLKIHRTDFVDEGVSGTTRTVLSLLPSHHQKVVVVDHDDPDHALGFVMGHNTLDNYWDTSDHSLVRYAANKGPNSDRPYHDYSSKVTGPIIGDLYRNFAMAWHRETGQTLPIPGFENYPIRGSDPKTVCQILRTQPQHSREDIMTCYLQAVSNASQYIAIENQYFRWPALADKIKQCAAGQTKWGRKPELHGDLYLFVITNSSDAGMGAGTVNTYRMLDSLGRADTIPEVARSQRLEEIDRQLDKVNSRIDGVNDQLDDTHSDIKRLDGERQALDQQARLLQGVAGASGGMTDRYIAINKKMEPLEARKRALEEETKPLEARKRQLEDAKSRLEPLSWRERNFGTDRTPEAIQQEAIPGLKVHVATLVAPDPKDGQDWQEVYIHAKLMLIDDTFMTMGSANINTRSMQVDSEMNIAHHRPEITGPLRQQQWAKYTGGRVSPGMGLTKAYREWADILKQNSANKKSVRRPLCQLAEFLRASADISNSD
jgi:phosphatidylserine/phosphatidylglycerophosphate/cardiolipin synthase-like enzyme